MKHSKTIAIIGGGPSGLMAADILSANGYQVTIYERKATFGRKFLMAGRGGLNITHSENIDGFIKKYGTAASNIKPLIDKLTPNDLRQWCQSLGEETFIGSSGRIFPKSFKASPLLRAWLKKLEKQNVIFKVKYDWQGWDQDKLIFKADEDITHVQADATLLCLGGASWPHLGSDGSWVNILKREKVLISPLKPSNCGFFVKWSSIFAEKFEGKSLKSVTLSFQGKKINGEFMITKNGVEGGAIYALSSFLRDEITRSKLAHLTLDLKPGLSLGEIQKRLQKPKAKLSTSNYLRKTLNLSDVAIGLLMELPDRKTLNDYSAEKMANTIKFYKLKLEDTFPIERAISTAGGVSFDAIDDNFMLLNKLNIYVSGEMLDWEAPTGGYLLQACIANGAYVANAIITQDHNKNI